ncbi:magnesium chelatase subunit D family protein [Desulfomonile tiedjei]|uniref:Mg-protoporphyrin IX chelatase n=1 Tax=Desulfomonile tiedjei (strain ATCC 49306 / DSM 6799 / DCB-1) TaxID=706587 RepID=I4BZM8_DESTA|nr:magnesium chelatase subunit D family protein [Desulfomonile tiedjei]AFM22769.1 Mg-chelatase subunit ChlI [Desulfomonile tiedjei DSM 6799]
MSSFNHQYPFSAIFGQDSMKLALLLTIINPLIGGVLIRGEKGTAKSTAVRALVRFLPAVRTNNHSSIFSTDKFQPPAHIDHENGGPRARVVTLPLHATEDMVLGGLDFSKSLQAGKPEFQPGLLARAHGGILYVDEVNLLSDHLVNTILDVTASGENLVQREGIFYRHPAKFVLVGTMNPEEGELRPQLLDRFGLCVEIKAETKIAARIEVLRRKDEFERQPQLFCKRFEQEDSLLLKRLSRAAHILPHVRLTRRIGSFIVEICTVHHVAGHRADVVIAHTARALASFEERTEIVDQDVERAAALALPHRSRLAAFENKKKKSGHSPQSSVVNPLLWEEYPDSSPRHLVPPTENFEEEIHGTTERRALRTDSPEAIFDIGQSFKVREIVHSPEKRVRQTTGRRSRTTAANKRGKYIRAAEPRGNHDLALDATLRAAAPHQIHREKKPGMAVVIRNEDIREKIRETRTGNFLLFLVDASGSMGAKGRMVASKGAIMSLLHDAYQKRDRIAMISFRKQEAVVNLPPTSSMYLAGKLLKELPVGGKTPLAAGLRKGGELLRTMMIKDPGCRPIVIVITDGKANEGIGKGDPFWEALAIAQSIASDKRIKSVVVDAEEEGTFHDGLAARLAKVMAADYFRIKDLKADVLLRIARNSGT